MPAQLGDRLYSERSGIGGTITVGDVVAAIPSEPIYSYFHVWAEENADLNTGAFEWAYGNGGSTIAGMGVVIGVDCELIALGLTIKNIATVEVEAQNEGASTGKSVSITSALKGFTDFSDDPISYVAGDVLGFTTLLGSTASNAGIITACFRKLVG